MTEPQPKKSDLGVRVLSAIVMVAVAGTALWLGGWVWTAFVTLVALGVLWEWWGLVQKFGSGLPARLIWMAVGLAYTGLAAAALVAYRAVGIQPALLPILYVVAVDVFAYLFGRAIGGPKIAPAISPSKTWAGFGGAVMGAAIVSILNSIAYDEFNLAWERGGLALFALVTLSIFIAAVAQTGDFFESWMKRRAGAKDSGNLIPGHGGLFDRVDGLIALLCVSTYFYWPF